MWKLAITTIIVFILLVLSGNLASAQAATPPPEPPRNFQATTAPNEARVNLRWGASATVGVHYRLYRSTVSGQKGAILQDDLDALSFTDSKASFNVVYYYQLVSILEGAESSLSPQLSATVARIPLNVVAADTKVGRQIKITWERPTLELPLRYHVYRSTTSSDLGGVIASNIDGTEFLDGSVADNIAYYYRVRAVELNGAQSLLTSDAANAIATDTVPPDPPTVSAGGNAAGQVGVSWSAPGNEPAARYYLYRDASPGGPGAQIFSGAATSYTDSGQARGAILYYTVTAIDAAGNVSRPSNAAQAVIPGTTAPASRPQIKVSNLAADGTPRPGEINLRWRLPGDNIAYARIYRSEREGEAGGMMADKVYGSSFLDKLVEGGKRYYYTVRLVDKDGTEYQGAPPVSATPFTQAAVSAPVEEPPASVRTDKISPNQGAGKTKSKSSSSRPQSSPSMDNKMAVKPSVKLYAYGQPRLPDLKAEAELALKFSEELRKELKGKMPAPRLWPQLVKQYVYGGYAAWEIAEDLKFGPGLVHPTLPAAKWRTMWGYGKHKKS